MGDEDKKVTDLEKELDDIEIDTLSVYEPIAEEDKNEAETDVKTDLEDANKSEASAKAEVLDETKTEEDNKAAEAETDEDTKSNEDTKKTEKTTEKVVETEAKPTQIELLMAEVERLSGLLPGEVKVETEEEKPVADNVIPLKIDDDGKVHDFIGDIDMDDVASDPAVLNKILSQVIKRVQQQTTEQVLLSIPQVVMSQVNQQSHFKRMADKFYDDNKDLVNVKQVVRACAQQIQLANPEWEVEKVFAETATKTRETLGMSAQKVESVVSGNGIPSVEDVAFGKSSGGSRSKMERKKSALQKELDEA